LIENPISNSFLFIFFWDDQSGFSLKSFKELVNRKITLIKEKFKTKNFLTNFYGVEKNKIGDSKAFL